MQKWQNRVVEYHWIDLHKPLSKKDLLLLTTLASRLLLMKGVADLERHGRPERPA
jgi:hypothetical protein